MFSFWKYKRFFYQTFCAKSTLKAMITFWVNGEAQARQAFSGVAGLLRENGPTRPDIERDAATASLMAKNTDVPRAMTGSPIPCKAKQPPGILYVMDVTTQDYERPENMLHVGADLWGVDGVGVVGVWQQVDVKAKGHVADSRDLVLRWTSSVQKPSRGELQLL